MMKRVERRSDHDYHNGKSSNVKDNRQNNETNQNSRNLLWSRRRRCEPQHSRQQHRPPTTVQEQFLLSQICNSSRFGRIRCFYYGCFYMSIAIACCCAVLIADKWIVIQFQSMPHGAAIVPSEILLMQQSTATTNNLAFNDTSNAYMNQNNDTTTTTALVAIAFDAMGRSGYVADPTSAIRDYHEQHQKNQNVTTATQPSMTTPEPTTVTTTKPATATPSSSSNPIDDVWAKACEIPPGEAEEGPQGVQGLWKIRQGLLLSKATTTNANQATRTIIQQQKDYPRILCLVYTHSNRHVSALRAIVDTWGHDCDGFLAISNQTDTTLGAVHIAHPGPETYKNMWQKVRYGWMYVYQHYQHQYDWFHIGGDDHYVIVYNLKQYIRTLSTTSTTATTSKQEEEQQQQDEPIYMGSSLTDHRVRDRFCGGGAGYTINRAALQRLALLLPTCFANATTSEEDRCIGRCFKHHPLSRSRSNVGRKHDGDQKRSEQNHHHQGIECRNTNDELDEQRYHALDAQFHAQYHHGQKVPWDHRALKRKHNITTTQIGLAQIAVSTISFHLASAMVESRHDDRGMRRYHALLHGKCGRAVDEQMAVIAQYNVSYLKELLQSKYNRNRDLWWLQRDKCAEVMLHRDQGYNGVGAKQHCGEDANRRKRILKRKNNVTTTTST